MKKVSIYNSYINDNPTKREMVANKLRKNGFETGGDGELMIVIGGDGTFLSAIRKRMHYNPIFVGFNTGNLGFLSEFKIDQFDYFMNVLKSGDYWIEEFPIFEVTIKENNGEKKCFFVNDFVIERKSTRILHLGVHVNEQKLCSVSGDGIIFSGSLGSTGYSMSAGGSLFVDAGESLQMTPICPVNSKSYQSVTNSVILNSENEITLFPNIKKQRSFRLVCDGKEIKSKKAKFIEVKKSTRNVRILRSKNYDRVGHIRNKMFDDE